MMSMLKKTGPWISTPLTFFRIAAGWLALYIGLTYGGKQIVAIARLPFPHAPEPFAFAAALARYLVPILIGWYAVSFWKPARRILTDPAFVVIVYFVLTWGLSSQIWNAKLSYRVQHHIERIIALKVPLSLIEAAPALAGAIILSLRRGRLLRFFWPFSVATALIVVTLAWCVEAESLGASSRLLVAMAGALAAGALIWGAAALPSERWRALEGTALPASLIAALIALIAAARWGAPWFRAAENAIDARAEARLASVQKAPESVDPTTVKLPYDPHAPENAVARTVFFSPSKKEVRVTSPSMPIHFAAHRHALDDRRSHIFIVSAALPGGAEKELWVGAIKPHEKAPYWHQAEIPLGEFVGRPVTLLFRTRTVDSLNGGGVWVEPGALFWSL